MSREGNPPKTPPPAQTRNNLQKQSAQTLSVAIPQTSYRGLLALWALVSRAMSPERTLTGTPQFLGHSPGQSGPKARESPVSRRWDRNLSACFVLSFKEKGGNFTNCSETVCGNYALIWLFGQKLVIIAKNKSSTRLHNLLSGSCCNYRTRPSHLSQDRVHLIT